MDLPLNQFKRRLSSGKAQFGLWLGLPDTICAEIGAGAGFDWLLIDAEHAPYSVRDVQNHLSAIEPYKVPAIVRPAEGSTALLKQLLDVGAQTLLIPMVDTAEQAKQLVQAVRYPPEGIRGLGTSMARAARWNRVNGYLEHANKEICLIVQAETTTAMKNLEEIVAVDGVDGVFIGPSDLSASMGHIGNPGHPEVVSAIEAGFKTILAAGKAAGVLAVDEALAKAYVEKGASFVGVGVDAALLSNATRQLASRFIDSDNDQPLAGY
ncbi:4-hydroxy-2-oxoheptanedioate aldolase [Dasania sp. GY-MA-18]|uniref:4-hydroxy-2-oxoheptanedioate aldolase n=1 Tax=Dasania phycosphaerae TaxID=2950436 RepID=A0A9J6RRL1_9GAMM|nr:MULTISPECIES: 4-hydroxy-2-oxoheptanedioate aldolase [Dasania]MCR8924268.1 4-hydroxy-2-oxoheptanedioate aldolase [Dasania sp. GY-MA-18]MCZ0866921.1 4-hydroxy-2-oxoheptanedioate aldolase [Dasania phycosphaerae]MCZ0870425.1 4-hydroxy-2-oxoheptanedioate aldolase [Dasania phycosphaerae]